MPSLYWRTSQPTGRRTGQRQTHSGQKRTSNSVFWTPHSMSPARVDGHTGRALPRGAKRTVGRRLDSSHTQLSTLCTHLHLPASAQRGRCFPFPTLLNCVPAVYLLASLENSEVEMNCSQALGHQKYSEEYLKALKSYSSQRNKL